ncbi:MAG TPA: hypothetical protein VH207_09055 [Chthoniobacterales bacterium]|jgi:hypothetical protein|nr:hypothetical protein [Chthoniobacterales bacterium]
MKEFDLQLERLLRAAAEATSERPNEMPFGFDSRVLARWRAGGKPDLVDLGRLLRRVVYLSLAVLLLAGAGVYHELSLPEAGTDSLGGDEYAIADSAISSLFEP